MTFTRWKLLPDNVTSSNGERCKQDLWTIQTAGVGEADRLLGEVMAARGYPVADFEQQAADLSVHHARVIEHYRAGHAIALRHAHGQAGTEDLRQALIHYRELFQELVQEPAGASAAAATR